MKFRLRQTELSDRATNPSFYWLSQDGCYSLLGLELFITILQLSFIGYNQYRNKKSYVEARPKPVPNFLSVAYRSSFTFHPYAPLFDLQYLPTSFQQRPKAQNT